MLEFSTVLKKTVVAGGWSLKSVGNIPLTQRRTEVCYRQVVPKRRQHTTNLRCLNLLTPELFF